jgi:hypothetical protein
LLGLPANKILFALRVHRRFDCSTFAGQLHQTDQCGLMS